MKHLFTFLLTLSCYIAVNAQSNVPAYIPSSGLKAWYPFDGNANDASGHGYNGTAFGLINCNEGGCKRCNDNVK